MIPCPRCGALGAEPCRTAAGHAARDWHKVREATAHQVGPLEAACVRSLASAVWLTPADELSRSLALRMCRSLDAAVLRPDQGMLLEGDSGKDSGKLYYGAATIMQLLDRLGLTPAGRLQLGIVEGDSDSDELAAAIERLGRPRLVDGGARVTAAEDLDPSR